MLVNELKEVKTFKVERTVPLKVISQYTKIPIVTLRKWIEDNERLDKARYTSIHKMYLFKLQYDYYLNHFLDSSISFEAILKKGFIIADSDNVLRSAKLLLDEKYLSKSNFPLKKISEETGIDYSLLKRYQKDPIKLETIAWTRVYRLAKAKEAIDMVDAFSDAIFKRMLDNDNYCRRHRT